jgi:hypothetical protein
MAFPQVTGYAASEAPSSLATPRAITIPGSFVAGDLLVAVISNTATRTYVWPAGWTEFLDDAVSGGLSAAYRVADGTEGATVTPTQSNFGAAIAFCLRVSGASGGTPEVNNVTATTAAPNPPSVTPSWGAEDTLWLAWARGNNPAISLLSYPPNYVSNQNSYLTADGLFESLATRERNIATEDPLAFSWDTSSTTIAMTMAIRPEAALMGQGML